MSIIKRLSSIYSRLWGNTVEAWQSSLGQRSPSVAVGRVALPSASPPPATGLDKARVAGRVKGSREADKEKVCTKANRERNGQV